MDNISEKWTAVVYNEHDKIATKTFIGEEEEVNNKAKEWADKYFPNENWTLHHQSPK
tara:strand:+ start:1089 stop:1259 length:171 start_codon:yes stop_codon:yes gene_type:complete